MLRGYDQLRSAYDAGRARLVESTTADGRPVVLKSAVAEHGQRLVEEHEILEDLRAVDGVVRAVGLEREGARTVLVLERFDGRDLAALIADGPLALAEGLSVAVRLAGILEAVHDAGVVHRDIKPPNVMVAEDGRVELIDFEASTRPSLGRPGRFGGTLAYMAPEQTGRMHLEPDARADLYALGVTLFEVLTGRLPFERARAVDYVQAHLAVQPPRADAINPAVPAVVAGIIDRLLRKDRALRYQTAAGLRADLERVAADLAAGRSPKPFALGRHDGRRQLPPGRIVGRAALVERLSRFVLEPGEQARFALLIGRAGIGKSSVTAAVRAEVVRHDGLLFEGRFEQHRDGRPLAGFARALEHLADQALSAPGPVLMAWRTALAQLGGLRAVLVELSSRFAVLAGADDAPDQALEVAPEAARNRLLLAMQQLLQIADDLVSGPVVLVLDDLQRADGVSLWLLGRLLETGAPLSVICAARPAEPAPWASLIEAGARAGAPPMVEHLAPLTDDDILELVSELTGRSPAEAASLAKATTDRSENNPLLARQFLTYLVDTDRLEPDPDGGFRWDLDAVMDAGLPETLAETVAARLHRLEPDARRVLTTAAVIGSTFAPQLVLSMCALPRRRVDQVLDQLRRQGLITVDERGWGFAHDRIHEVAYGLLDADAQAALNRRIGETLLDRLDEAASEGEIFAIVDHLNRAGSPEDPGQLARLNLRAGQRALNRGAWQAAADYLDAGARLTAELPEGTEGQLRLELSLGAAHATFLVGRHEEADARFQAMLKGVTDPALRLRIITRRVMLLTARDRMSEAIDAGLSALARHGVRLRRGPGRLERALAFFQARRATTIDRIRSWPELPPVDDEVSALVLELLAALVGACYAVDKALFTVVSCRTVIEIDRRGHAPAAGNGLMNFIILLLGRGYVDQAQAALEVALTLGEGLPQAEATRMAYVRWLIGRPWVQPFGECAVEMRGAANRSLEAGDIEYGMLLLTGMHIAQFFAADDLRRLQGDLAETRRRLGPHSAGARLMVQEHMQHSVGCLTGDRVLDPEHEARGTFPEQWANVIERRLLFSVPLLCVFGHYDLAVDAAERIKGPRSQQYFGLAFGVIFDVFHAFAALCAERPGAMAITRRAQRRLSECVGRCPPNFEPGQRLLEAEIARHRRRWLDAFEAYGRAAEAARRAGNRLLSGLVEERWAELYGALGLSAEHRLHLDEARAVYAAWGARAKVDLLEPETAGGGSSVRALSGEALPALSSIVTTVPPDDVGEILDMETVWDVARSLSGDLRLEAVVPVVLDAALRNAGATSALLALTDEAQTLQAAGRRMVNGGFERLDGPLDEVVKAPHALIRYVARTGESVVLDRAANGRFEDAALTSRPWISVLCVPLSTLEGAVGVLYLENGNTSGAFTEARIRAMQLIGTQAAVSLANARLHQATERLAQTLEQRVAARTAELAVARDQALDATRAKSAFLAAMSHEIRTPMNGLLGTAQLLAETALDARQRAYVDIISGSADSLLRVLNDILDFSKIEAGRFEISPFPFALRPTVEGAASTVSELASRKGLALEVHIDDGLPPDVSGDAARLRQVLLNLLGNAIKFTASGMVSLSVTHEGERMRYAVRDTGIGIGPEQLGRLFEPFAQADSSISRRFGGTGLGLAICRRLVELMGGEIGVDSAVGVGSTFWFELPLVIAESAPPPARPSTLSIPPADRADVPRVLVVEDNPVNQKITGWMLERNGYACDVVDNGRLALEAESAGDYDVILMDCQMPELDGLEATRRLRARGCELPIVALSAGAMDEERAACIAAGMDDFVAKPIRLPVLLDTLERFVGTPSMNASASALGLDETPEAAPSG